MAYKKKMSGKRRIVLIFILFCIAMVFLCIRVGWQMIVKSDELTEKAIEQQTKDVPIEAARGNIYDCNGNELAVSGTTYSIWARPANISAAKKSEKKEAEIDKTAEVLAELLDMKESEVKKLITKKQSLVKVAKYVDKDTVEKIRNAEIISETTGKKRALSGIESSEEAKRYYISDSLACHVLGSVTDDNNGLSGIELQYNKYLKGVNGRWVKNTDVGGNELVDGSEEYYGADNGMNVTLTIDTTLQQYAESAIATVKKKTKADRVMIASMNPETGEILAMATTPGFNPNNSRVPSSSSERKKFKDMSSEKQIDYLNKMWRNSLISDTYEPGSTFKLLTTSIALEEGLTNPSERFNCGGSIRVADTVLKCWRSYDPHGVQTLEEAVGNSCNPVFVQLSKRIGIKRYYEYLKLFGVTDRTGVDFPGEGTAILQDEKSAGPVGLATISYGQGVAVTPIELLSAVCAIGNDGNLMKPHFMKEITDSNGKVVETFENTKVRQVLSKKTAREMRNIMEYVVSKGGAGTAKVPGYSVGGKTGTANKAKNGGYSEQTYSSFIGMAPMDDPKIAVLVIVDNPKGIKFGSQTAAPGAQEYLKKALKYLNIKTNYTDKEKEQMASEKRDVPDVCGKDASEAIGILGGYDLKYAIKSGNKKDDFVVKDQYPKPGAKIKKGSKVYLYGE